MKFNIWKGKRKREEKSNTADNKDVVQVKKKQTQAMEENENYVNQIANEQNVSEGPNYVSISKIYSLSGINVYSGIASNKKASGGMQYVLIEPTMEPGDWKNFDTIRKMLITELRVDLSTIKTSKDAEERLRTKIQYPIISKTNWSK